MSQCGFSRVLQMLNNLLLTANKEEAWPKTPCLLTEPCPPGARREQHWTEILRNVGKCWELCKSGQFCPSAKPCCPYNWGKDYFNVLWSIPWIWSFVCPGCREFQFCFLSGLPWAVIIKWNKSSWARLPGLCTLLQPLSGLTRNDKTLQTAHSQRYLAPGATIL